jgi:putative SOS response-associated peptidase YedK
MCGRYTLLTPAARLAAKLGVDGLPDNLAPRYNIAPGQDALVIRRAAEGPGREAAALRWGLVPHWSKPGEAVRPLINARSETAATKAAFRDSFRHRRCLVPADGFYEWERNRPAGTGPLRFRLRDGEPFLLAGLWARWLLPDGEPLESFALLTTSANALVGQIHDRMPALLRPEETTAWLDGPPESAGELLRPFPAEEMEALPASPLVNRATSEGPDCLLPPPPPAESQLSFL